jgi:protein-S-isoprenylcysteine O-methyltransferase Ste14
MDPEIYVFPGISSAPVKIAASTALFVLALAAAGLLLPLLPGPHLWAAVDRSLALGSLSISLARLLHLLLGYGLFIYGSYHAWRATRLKNTVERLDHELATRILDTGYYARTRHPMYGMFILANAGLGSAMSSVYGLVFSLLSLGLFIANGIFEERAVMVRFFGEEYRAYMRRVRARYFTPVQAAALVVILGLNVAGVFFR